MPKVNQGKTAKIRYSIAELERQLEKELEWRAGMTQRLNKLTKENTKLRFMLKMGFSQEDMEREI
jgi:cell shape-determining protein MreC